MYNLPTLVSILVIEPETALESFLSKTLVNHGHQVQVIADAGLSLDAIEEHQPDLVLLDHHTHSLTSTSIAREIKKSYPNLPVLLLLNELEVEKTKRLFRSGINDFITKPIDTNRLLSRISMQFLDQTNQGEELIHNQLTVNTRTKQAFLKDKPLTLTPKEFKLLVYLLKNTGRVLSREQIIAHVWGYNIAVEDRVVDVYVGYLRKKLASLSKSPIQTVRGFGYVIRE